MEIPTVEQAEQYLNELYLTLTGNHAQDDMDRDVLSVVLRRLITQHGLPWSAAQLNAVVWHERPYRG